MAKKRRIKSSVQDTEVKSVEQNKEILSDNDFSSEELQEIKDYEPLNFSLKTHFLLGVGLFVFFSLLFFLYLKVIKTIADKKIEQAKYYFKIAESLDKADTEQLALFQETENYDELNKLQSYLGRDLGNMFQFIREKHIADSYLIKIKETEVLIPEVLKIVKERREDYFKDVDISYVTDLYSKTGNELIMGIKSLLETNKEITEIGDYEKTKNHLQKSIFDLKNVYYDFENQTIRIRALWNKAAAYDAIIELLQKAINDDNQSIEAYYYLGKTYELMKEYGEAGVRYAQLFKIDKNHEFSQEIMKKFKEAIKKSPNDLQDRYNLGVAYMYSGEESLAIKEFKNPVFYNEKNKNSYLTFMAKKHIGEINNKTPEVIYDPRM